MENLNVITGFLRGGLVMWPILLFSIIGLAIIIEKFYVLRNTTKNLSRMMIPIREFIKRKDIVNAINYCSENPSTITNIVRRGISKIHLGHDRIKETIESAGKQEILKLEKGLSTLGTISGVAPLLGFLGTVTGLLSAFMRVEQLSGNVTPSDLAGGIWEALITTVFGLTVGIIAYIFYNYFVSRISKIITEMEIATTELIDVLYEEQYLKK